MFFDDWPTQATRSLWCMMQEEYPKTLQNVLGNDCPTLAVATKRFRVWIEEDRIHFSKRPDGNFKLEQEMVSCALGEVDWYVITHRIALALSIPIREISDSLICPKCQMLICQLCMSCANPSCENAHRVDCLSEYKGYQLGPFLFDFTDRKLVIRVGDYEMPISPKEYKRFYTWLDIRKNG